MAATESPNAMMISMATASEISSPANTRFIGTSVPRIRCHAGAKPLLPKRGAASLQREGYAEGMDPNNPVVRLCAEGMELERAGRKDEAARVFAQAWEQSSDDFERCVSAHYVARGQSRPEENLRWNLVSLEHADAILDGRVDGFYPSLYLNIGWAHEDLGHRDEARTY